MPETRKVKDKLRHRRLFIFISTGLVRFCEEILNSQVKSVCVYFYRVTIYFDDANTSG